MGGEDGGASWKFKKAAKKLFVLQTCGSFCHGQQQAHVSPVSTSSLENQKRIVTCMNMSSTEIAEQGISSTSPSSNKSLCAICLDPLNYSSVTSRGKAIFTAQCSHAFHFACITSNVSHGSVTCPICRAHWTQLPRNLNHTRWSPRNKTDPVLQILDDSIANLRVHRRSFFRSSQYNDDDDGDHDHDPVELDHTSVQTRLSFSLLTYPSFNPCPHQDYGSSSPNNGAYLCVKLAHQPATDLVLVASPNGPHPGLMKQAMVLVVSSLRPIDRMAIVTCSSASASHVCTLRRMTSHGKRNALKIIDQLFYSTTQADPTECLEGAAKILEDRVHKNLQSCILHLTDTPSRSNYHRSDSEIPITIRRFDVGSRFGACDGYIVQEFEEFLARTLGGQVEDIHLRIGDREMVVRIGELRGGEERNIPMYLGESGRVCVKYSYRDGGSVRAGDVVVVGMMEDDKGDDRRSSNGGNWDYHDPYMARRWARHLHGYRV